MPDTVPRLASAPGDKDTYLPYIPGDEGMEESRSCLICSTVSGGQVTEVTFSTIWRMRTKLHFSIARVIGNLQTQRPPQGVAGHAEDWERRICPIFHSFSKFEPMCHMGHAISMLCSSHDRGGQGKVWLPRLRGGWRPRAGNPFWPPPWKSCSGQPRPL